MVSKNLDIQNAPTNATMRTQTYIHTLPEGNFQKAALLIKGTIVGYCFESYP